MAGQFKNLCFEGGGVKGIAYVGAMKVLKEQGCLDEIIRVGGTSAGSINALIVALGMSLDEQQEELSSLKFKEFMDDSWGVIRDVNRLVNDFGYYKGDFFESWIGTLIEKKLGNPRATFNDLKTKNLPDLYVCATNLSTGFGEVFSHERHPDMPLAEALRMSMSIPLFFSAVRNGEFNDVYVDGGVQRNYPIKLFDRLKYVSDSDQVLMMELNREYYQAENSRFMSISPNSSPYVYNRETLGFRLDSKEEIGIFRHGEEPQRKPVDSFTDFAKALIKTVINAQENMHLHSDDWQRTIYIDSCGVRTTDFDLAEGKKKELLASGIDCTKKYFDWFNSPSEKPINRMPSRKEAA